MIMRKVPSDEEILSLLAERKRAVSHDVTAAGLHRVEITWQGGWSKSGAQHREYTIALRAALVGMTPFLSKDERAERLRALTPVRLRASL
jgi:hypothetical protein